MPKNNKVTKTGNGLHKQKVSATFRIGTRKSGKSAHTMTNDALLAVLENKSQAKYHNDARAVLSLRGVTL